MVSKNLLPLHHPSLVYDGFEPLLSACADSFCPRGSICLTLTLRQPKIEMEDMLNVADIVLKSCHVMQEN